MTAKVECSQAIYRKDEYTKKMIWSYCFVPVGASHISSFEYSFEQGYNDPKEMFEVGQQYDITISKSAWRSE